MLVDAHTHVFPPSIAAARTAYQERDDWFGQLYASPSARIASADDLRHSMDRSGFDYAVIASFGWRDAQIGRACADYMLDAARASNGKLLALAYIQPTAAGDAARQLERDLADGFVGVGELMPDGQGFSLDDHELLTPVLSVAADAGVPVLVHVSEPVGHRYPGKGTVAVAAMWRLARAFPRVRFIAAHWGGGLPFYELMPDVQLDLANVWYDSAATAYLYQPRVFSTCLEIVGADRVLFASDFPVLRQGPLLRAVRGLALPDEVTARLLGENAAALFGVQPESGASRATAPADASSPPSGRAVQRG